MNAKIWIPRLTPRQIEDLTASLNRLDQIHDSVAATNMQGKPAVLALTVEVYRSIERVIGSVQRAVQNAQTRGAGELAGQEPPEGA